MAQMLAIQLSGHNVTQSFFTCTRETQHLRGAGLAVFERQTVTAPR